MQSSPFFLLLILIFIGPCLGDIVFVLSFNESHISSFKPVEITTSSGPGTLNDFNQIPQFGRVLMGPRGSAAFATSPVAFFGSSAPRRGSLSFHILKTATQLPSGTTLTIAGARQGAESSTYTPMTVFWASPDHPDGPGLIWKITNPKGASTMCKDEKFDDFAVGTWLTYMLAWDFDGISGAPRINTIMDRNSSSICSTWIDDGGLGLAENSNPIAMMANPSGSTLNDSALYLYSMTTFDEPTHCSDGTCRAYPNNRRTTLIIGIVVVIIFIAIAVGWISWFSMRNPSILTLAAWKRACLHCEFFSSQNELSILQRNALEDEITKQDRGESTGSNENPAPSIPHSVATLGGNAIDSKGRFKRNKRETDTLENEADAEQGDEGSSVVLLNEDSLDNDQQNSSSRWGGIEHDFADSSASDSQHTSDEDDDDTDDEELQDIKLREDYDLESSKKTKKKSPKKA